MSIRIEETKPGWHVVYAGRRYSDRIGVIYRSSTGFWNFDLKVALDQAIYLTSLDFKQLHDYMDGLASQIQR